MRTKLGSSSLPHDYEKIYKVFKSCTKGVLLISHEFSLSGAPMALFNAAKVLKNEGYSPVVFSPVHGDIEPLLRAEGIEYIVDESCYARLLRQDESFVNFLGAFQTILFNTIVALVYAQHMQTQNQKILWVHEGKFGFELVSKTFNIQDAMQKVDRIYSVGAYSKTFTDKYAPRKKTYTLLYGIEDAKLTLPKISVRGKLSFGIFGSCSERKGTELFVEAVSELPQEIREMCEFKIVGRVEDTEYCKRVIEAAHRFGIRVTGQLSHDETIQEMSNTDVLVCPSLDDPMPIVCTEAMALSKVILCSDCTGTAAFIENGINGFVICLETERLCDVMERVFQNRHKLHEIGRRGREIYEENFTESIFKENLLRVIGL